MATIKQLNATNPAFDVEELRDLEALYKGGKAVASRVKRLLPQNPSEPGEIYEARCKEFRYRNYFGPICNYLGALLFQKAPLLRLLDSSDKTTDPPETFAEWREDCDGKGCDLDTFLHERFTKAMVCQTTYFEVVVPDVPEANPQSLAEHREAGLDAVRLRALEPCNVIEWEVDDDGCLVFLVEHTEKLTRPLGVEGDRDTVIERWRVFTPETTFLYEKTYKKDDKPKDDVTVTATAIPNKLGRIPLVECHLPDALYLGELLASPQVAHLRLNNALSWALKRTAYPTPVMNVMAEEARKGLPTLGAGYGLKLGLEESFQWVGPPEAPYKVMSEEVSTEKDEMYRVTHEMALGVDNNAASVGRSGDSKLADAEATNVILQAYAECVVEMYGRTLELVSAARSDLGKDARWSVEGFKDFKTVPLSSLVEIAANPALDIPSKTFRLHLAQRVVDGVLSDLDQATRQVIAKELEAGINEAMEHAALMREAQQMGVEGGQLGDEEEDDGKSPVGKPKAKPQPGGKAA